MDKNWQEWTRIEKNWKELTRIDKNWQAAKSTTHGHGSGCNSILFYSVLKNNQEDSSPHSTASLYSVYCMSFFTLFQSSQLKFSVTSLLRSSRNKRKVKSLKKAAIVYFCFLFFLWERNYFKAEKDLTSYIKRPIDVTQWDLSLTKLHYNIKAFSRNGHRLLFELVQLALSRRGLWCVPCFLNMVPKFAT